MTETHKLDWDSPKLMSCLGFLMLGERVAGKDFVLTETDIQWIEGNITSHRLFRATNAEVNPFAHTNTYAYAAEFLSMFLDTPGIPQNVNRLLYLVIGVCNEFDKIKQSTIEPERVFFIQRWMETCR